MVTLFPPLLPASDFDHFRYFLWRSPVAFAPRTWLTAQRGAVRSVTGHVTGLSSHQWPRDIPLHTHAAFVHPPGPASGTWAPRRGPGGRWLPSPPPCSGGGGRGCARASPRSHFELLWVSGQKRARRAGLGRWAALLSFARPGASGCFWRRLRRAVSPPARGGPGSAQQLLWCPVRR